MSSLRGHVLLRMAHDFIEVCSSFMTDVSLCCLQMRGTDGSLMLDKYEFLQPEVRFCTAMCLSVHMSAWV